MAKAPKKRPAPRGQAFSTNSVASAARTASADSGPLSGYADVKQLVYQVNVTAVTGTNPTLDVYLQTSYDGGATWQDVAHGAQITAAARRVVATREPQSDAGNVASATHAASDKALAADTVSPIPLGDLIRWAWVIGGTATPTFTFRIDAVART